MIVYKITNIIDNKKYFGYSSGTLQKRWKGHCENTFKFNSNYCFHNAIRKYGRNNFKKEVIRVCKTIKEAKVWERIYIRKFKTNINRYGHDFGYNMTDGGEGTSGFKWTEKQKENCSKAQKRRFLTQDSPMKRRCHTKKAKKKMSKSTKKQIERDGHPMKNKHHSEKTKKKISKARKKYFKEHPEAEEKFCKNRKNKKCSKEHRKNISKARIGMKLTEEHKENIRRANLGKTISLEQRVKISESVKKLWEDPKYRKKRNKKKK